MVRILWLSARVLDLDLCRTTQISLAEGLVNAGFEITIASPGAASESSSFNHIRIKQLTIPGLKTLSVARSIRKLTTDHNALMVDWRLVPFIRSWLVRTGKPWYLVDRGPPANSGLLARLQWGHWKKAWKSTKRGMAVSRLHSRFIKEKTGTDAAIDILPAGAHPSDTQLEPRMGASPAFIYIGKVDRNRNVELLPELVIEKGGSLKIIGAGDVFGRMQRKWHGRQGINILEQMPHDQVTMHLKESDIGLLPMPDTQVWRIASPLKLAEYASAGLLVAGVDHPGNSIDQDVDWLFLDDDISIAMDEAIERICNQEIIESAIRYANENMGWEVSVRNLRDGLMEMLEHPEQD